MAVTWKPHDSESSSPDNQAKLPDSAFAFPGRRKEPMTDASHVRNAIARFDQVKGRHRCRAHPSFRELESRRQTLQGRTYRELMARPRQQTPHPQQSRQEVGQETREKVRL